MDEVFGVENSISLITFKKTAGLGTGTIQSVSDYLIFYAKDKKAHKYRQIYQNKILEGDSAYTMIEDSEGNRRRMTKDELFDHSLDIIGNK